MLFSGSVDPTATIGIALIDTSTINLGCHSRIGHATVVRNLSELTLEAEARIGTLNWIFGARGSRNFSDDPDRFSALRIRRGGSVTSRHIIDCTDTVEIGSFATIAGFRSQILTHSIDVVQNKQRCAKVHVGDYCFVGTGVIILKGAKLPANSVLSAGSVYSGSGDGEFRLYGGVPARSVRLIDENAGYMKREGSRVL